MEHKRIKSFISLKLSRIAASKNEIVPLGIFILSKIVACLCTREYNTSNSRNFQCFDMLRSYVLSRASEQVLVKYFKEGHKDSINLILIETLLYLVASLFFLIFITGISADSILVIIGQLISIPVIVIIPMIGIQLGSHMLILWRGANAMFAGIVTYGLTTYLGIYILWSVIIGNLSSTLVFLWSNRKSIGISPPAQFRRNINPYIENILKSIIGNIAEVLFTTRYSVIMTYLIPTLPIRSYYIINQFLMSLPFVYIWFISAKQSILLIEKKVSLKTLLLKQFPFISWTLLSIPLCYIFRKNLLWWLTKETIEHTGGVILLSSLSLLLLIFAIALRNYLMYKYNMFNKLYNIIAIKAITFLIVFYPIIKVTQSFLNAMFITDILLEVASIIYLSIYIYAHEE